VLALVLTVLIFPLLYSYYNSRTSANQTTTAVFDKFLSNKQPEIKILLYHYVENVTDERDFIRESLNTPPSLFEKQLQQFINSDYEFIFASEIPNVDVKLDKKYAVITFDDGYEDYYTDAFPILKRLGLKSTNYIVYNFIGKPNYMNKNQISELVNSGLVEIGSHTLNHLDLTSISLKDAVYEIQRSKELLERDYKVSITSFCYPYGFYDTEIIKAVVKAGYTNGVASSTGKVNNLQNLFKLPRVKMGKTL